MHYKAVIFDFDYTLADATEAIIAGFQYAFGKMGLPCPEREAVRRTVGHMLADEYTILTGDRDPERIRQFKAYYVEKAAPLQVQGTKLFPGAEELLRALHAAGIPTALVSSKGAQTLRDVLAAQGILDQLTSITGGDMVAQPKPHPEGLLAAVAAMGLTPGEILYCGDTVIDAETAQRAGAPFCAVLNGTTGKEAFAPYPCVYTAPDLPALHRWLAL